MNITRLCVVSGKVHGVFFRQSTVDQATKLGITGWVRNTDEGNVECLMSGEQEVVEVLTRWLHEGPPSANVLKVVSKDLPFEEHDTFVIKK